MSAFTRNAAVWRCRTDGVATNGGCYDSTVSGAGTDYSQQITAQLSLTDVTCAGGAATTITSVVGGFTSAMVGNGVRLRNGTGANFDDGYYVVVTFTDANNVVLDRAPASGGAATLGALDLGGALEYTRTLTVMNSTSTAGLKIIPGNTVYIRGAGSYDPGAADYTTTGFITIVSGDSTNGWVKIIGENGRPWIQGNGLMFFNQGTVEFNNLVFSCSSNNSGSSGVLNGSALKVLFCKVMTSNQTGMTGIVCGSGSLIAFNEVDGGRSAASSSAHGISAGANINALVAWNYVHDVGDAGITTGGANVINNIVYKAYGASIRIGGSGFGMYVMNNTLDAGLDDGIEVTGANSVLLTIINNLITNHSQASKYAINFTSGTTAANDRIKQFADWNWFYNNTSNYQNVTAGANDVALGSSPYTAAAPDFTVDSSLFNDAAPQVNIGGRTTGTRTYVTPGAVQPQGGGGGAGTNPFGGSVM